MSDGPEKTRVNAKAGTSEPPEAPSIECPPELGPAARKMWDRLIPLLSKTRALSPFDEGQIAIYCTAYSYWLDATEALQKYGTVMKSPKGYPFQSPYVSIANKNAATMTEIADKYGFLLIERQVPRLKLLSDEL